MPELPDAEIERRYIDATALHRAIDRCRFGDEQIIEGVTKQKIARALDGRALERTARRGKFIGVQTDAGPWLILHLGMTGFLEAHGDAADRPDYWQLVIHFEDGGELAYVNKRKLGELSIVDDFETFCDGRDLGPDALEVGLGEFRSMLEGRRGQIKPLLMNQSVIAGIGNVYADEMLFQAGIRPDRPAGELSEGETADLHEAMLRVLRVAIDHKADPHDMPDTWILPLRRDDEAECPACGGPLRSEEISGRKAVLCPKCQA